MNKNTGNHKRKGPQRGPMQNKNKGENEIQGEEMATDLNPGTEIHPVNTSDVHNVSEKKSEIHLAEPLAEGSVKREREVPQAGSWTTKKTQEEQKIHPGESSGEKIQLREKETHRMVSWNKEHKDWERVIHEVETAGGNKMMSEVDILEAKSQAAKNTDSVDGYGATVRAKMYNQDPVGQPSLTHMVPEDHSRMEDIRSAPAMGTILYTVAVLLVIGWAIGFFFYNAGDLIHVLLVLALFAVLIRVAQGRSDG